MIQSLNGSWHFGLQKLTMLDQQRSWPQNETYQILTTSKHSWMLDHVMLLLLPPSRAWHLWTEGEHLGSLQSGDRELRGARNRSNSSNSWHAHPPALMTYFTPGPISRPVGRLDLWKSLYSYRGHTEGQWTILCCYVWTGTSCVGLKNVKSEDVTLRADL